MLTINKQPVLKFRKINKLAITLPTSFNITFNMSSRYIRNPYIMYFLIYAVKDFMQLLQSSVLIV